MPQSMTGIWIARIVVFLLAAFCVWFFLLRDMSCNNDSQYISGTTIYKHDTTIVERVITKTDTVIKWYDKIIYKKSEPVIVNFQKVDTVFLNNAKKLDLIMKLVKKGHRLDAFTININDTLLKESIFLNVGQDFSVTSQAGKVFVKSKRLYWNKLIFAYEHTRDIKDIKNKYSHNLQALSGINYMDKIHLNVGLKYNLSNPSGSILDNTSLKAEIIYKPFY